MSFDIADGTLLSGVLNLPMPGTGHVQGSFKASNVAAGFASPVEGGIEARMNNIAVAAALTPMIDVAGGSLTADIKFSGNLGEPVLVGRVSIDNGLLSYQPLGLRVEDLNLQANLSEERQVSMGGTFRIGEGRGEVRTSTAYLATAATGLQLEIKGERLRLIDVPDVLAIANVDMNLSYEADLLRIGGELFGGRQRVSHREICR